MTDVKNNLTAQSSGSVTIIHFKNISQWKRQDQQSINNNTHVNIISNIIMRLQDRALKPVWSQAEDLIRDSYRIDINYMPYSLDVID